MKRGSDRCGCGHRCPAVRLPDGQVTTLDFPGNEDGTTALGINRKGQVVGYYLLGGPCTAYTFCGFVWKP